MKANINKKIQNKLFAIVAVSVSCLVLSQSVFLNRIEKCAEAFSGTKELKTTVSNRSTMDAYPLPTSGATSYSNYLTHYFDNLTCNFGMNYDSSCGYVALAMLLSYYDAYFDEYLVSTARDKVSTGNGYNLVTRKNSPGSLHDDFDTTNFSSIYSSFPGANLYLTYCNLIAYKSLHATLITIGAALGYVNTAVTNGGFTTTLYQRENILENYLENYINLSTTAYTITSDSYDYSYYMPIYDNMISNICSLIANGHPVLLGINNSGYNSIGHAVIAYDYTYNQSNSSYTIYCHPGLSNQGCTTHMTITQMGYSLIQNYMAIDFNYTSQPDTNYAVTINNNTSYYPYNSNLLNWQSGT